MWLRTRGELPRNPGGSLELGKSGLLLSAPREAGAVGLHHGLMKPSPLGFSPGSESEFLPRSPPFASWEHRNLTAGKGIGHPDVLSTPSLPCQPLPTWPGGGSREDVPSMPTSTCEQVWTRL